MASAIGRSPTGRDVDGPNVRDGGRKDFAGDGTGVPTTEREAHEIRNIERIGFRHRSTDQTRIRIHFRFTAWNKFNRDSHRVPARLRDPLTVMGKLPGVEP
jgi:hypothetical protein